MMTQNQRWLDAALDYARLRETMVTLQASMDDQRKILEESVADPEWKHHPNKERTATFLLTEMGAVVIVTRTNAMPSLIQVRLVIQ